jgi:50S ribosomal subunit-associated GTPase HflX
MTDETSAKIEAELQAAIEADLQAELARKRMEIARRLRREAEMKEYDRINARHPIEGPGDPKAEAARRAAMDARARADMESMDRSNSRPIEGSLLHQRSRASIGPGGESFRFKSPGS